MASASSHTHPGQGRGTSRADDVLTLARLSAKPDAVRDILRWLALRTGGQVALISVDGTVLAGARRPHPATAPRPPGDALASAGRAVVDLHRHGTPSAVLPPATGPGGAREESARAVRLIRLGRAADHSPYLAVATETPDEHHRCAVLLGDAARALGLCWRLEEAERLRRRVEFAEANSREAVLHLLMIGSLPAAHRIAAALRPRLPRLARVFVIECPGRRRSEIADRISGAAHGGAWIVPCPVRPNHLIALVPGEARHDPGGEPELDEVISERFPDCRVGVSEQIPLRETSTGYEQAFHALAVARYAPAGHARFSAQDGPAPLVGPPGGAWARRLLAPCLAYLPPRRADPGAEELLATLGSWLTFGSAAGRHLKIHRNTLAARVRLLDGLLGLEVSHRLADQSAAWLALRLLGEAPLAGAGPEPELTLEELLARPAMSAWAKAHLRPLEFPETVRAWLLADARIPETAAALGLSRPGTRKRIAKAELALGRSLLHAPSAKYELWLAMRALGVL